MNLNLLKEQEFNRREERLKSAKLQKLEKNLQKKQKLHIVYVMTWTELCGGSKIILEHANRLIDRGQEVTIVTHYDKPLWFTLNEKINFIQVPFDKVLGESIPLCDVIIVTYWKEIYECIEQKIAPVIYFEQGDAHLFDSGTVDNRTSNYIKKQFEVTNFILTVSNFAKEKIKERYNKEAYVISNAIDNKIFYPQENIKIKNADETAIALIGSIDWEFKGISNILKAIEILQNEGFKIKVNWVSRSEPVGTNFKAIVNPKQIVIGDILRESDIYICASKYESFCLPVLEAMNCGTAVITTDNGGIRDYVIVNKNALIIEKNNVLDIVDKVKILINNKKLREQLSINALQTAKRFNWETIIDNLLEYYREIACYSYNK